MAQATHHHNQFHNLSNEALADALGGADLALKAHEVEVKALKDEFKSPRPAHSRGRALHGHAGRTK